MWPLSGKSASAEVGRGKANTLNSLNLKLCLTVDQCVWILKCAFDKAVLRLCCFNCFALADRMALKVLVGCKRVIDYAVKIRVRPDNLGVRKFLNESLSIRLPGGDRGSEAQHESFWWDCRWRSGEEIWSRSSEMFRPSHVFECMLQVRMKEKKLVKEIVVVSCGPAQVIGVWFVVQCRSQCFDMWFAILSGCWDHSNRPCHGSRQR